MNNFSDNENIIKNLIKNIEGKNIKTSGINKDELAKKLKAIDKGEVMRKLNSMGLGSIAQRLKTMSDEDILREVAKNPAILKKVNSFMNKS